MKDKIAETLLNLMDSQSYSKISVKTICESVPISRTAFYHYFNNKEEIIMYFIEQDFLENCFPIFKFHLKERGSQTFFSYLKNHKSFYTKICQVDQGALLYRCLKKAYYTGFTRRREFFPPVSKKRPPVTPEFFYQYSSSGIAAVVIDWVKTDMKTPEESIARDLYMMMEEPMGKVIDSCL